MNKVFKVNVPAFRQILMRVIYALAVLVLGFQIVGWNTLVSISFHLCFGAGCLLWLSSVKHLQRSDYIAFALIAVSLICVCTYAMLSKTAISVSYFNKFILFAGSVLLLTSADKLEMDAGTYRFIRVCTFSICLVFLAGCILGGKGMYELNGVQSAYLTFHFTNPNLASMFLVCLVMLEASFSLFARNWKGRVCHGAAALVMSVFMVLTKSRNTILAFLVFLVLVPAAYFYRKKHGRLSRWICVLIAVWPLIFAALYFAILTNDGLVNMFSFLTGHGKELDSRVEMWSGAFELYRNSPMVGAYNGGQMHNSHIEVLVNYGPGGLILMCLFLYYLLRNCSFQSFFSAVYLSGFIAVICLGMGEAALFSGGLSFYVFAAVFLLTANSGKLADCPDVAEV